MTTDNEEIQRLRAEYRSLNESFKEVLVYHVGIDAGFFAEYTYMLNVMLYCLTHKIQFRLYSADANFRSHKGWTDFFQPFCPEETNPLHHQYNKHPVPSLWEITYRALREDDHFKVGKYMGMVAWNLKQCVRNVIGSRKISAAYGHKVLLNFDADYAEEHSHYSIPQLGIDGDYLQAFNRMVDITWHFNEETQNAIDRLANKMQLPQQYIGTQVRGGDKITEVDLITTDNYVELFRKACPDIRDVFMLTDDYRLFEELQHNHPDYRFATLCTPAEHGYVNSQFSEISGEEKKIRMQRLLASMEMMMRSTYFVGSITTGPSFFVLKRLYPDCLPIDAKTEDVPTVARMRIYKRGQWAKEYGKKK